MSLIEQIKSPTDLKKLSLKELDDYACEVREKIISTVGIKGGHLASNLGAVELSIALHYVFDCPDDCIFFDTGHQSYTHKIITGVKNSRSGVAMVIKTVAMKRHKTSAMFAESKN